MKKVLSVILAIILLLTSLSLVSCSVVKEVDSIDGVSAKEAYFNAMDLINSSERYEVVVDMKIEVDLFLFSIPVKIDGFYFYSYDGVNEHHGITEAGEELIENELIKTIAPDAFSGYDKELWYVDGICYYITSSGSKEKFESDTSPVQRSDLEREVNYILENDMAEATCYKKGDQYYFELVLEEDDVRLDVDGTTTKEIYTIYFDNDGYIDTISVESESEGFSSTLTMHYTYDGLDPITAPEDADSFIEV